MNNGLLVKLTNGKLCWHIYNYQRMLKGGSQYGTCRLIELDETGLKPAEDKSGNYKVYEVSNQFIKVLGSLHNDTHEI